MLRRQLELSSDAFVSTRARAHTHTRYQSKQASSSKALRSRDFETTSSCTAHGLTLTRSSSRRSSTSPKPRALSARPRQAALWNLMIIVGTKERAKARTKPHNIQRVGCHRFGSYTGCCTASFIFDGVKSRSRRAPLHLDAGRTLRAQTGFGTP